MEAYDRSARDTLSLPDRAGSAGSAPWAVFEPDWYRARYPGAPAGSDEELLEWHVTHGQTQGHSPNRYFDEEWQLHNWPGIVGLIEAGSVASAFDAWCRGPHATRPPHWLFDPVGYGERYPGITDESLAQSGLINHYHHFLAFGAAEHRIGHHLFNPKVYLDALDPAAAEAAASLPFRHYLQGLESGAPERRTSVLFDPTWYAERYPDAMGSGQYRSVLEHYLRGDRPAEFDPSPWFSETHYLGANPGLAEAIGPEGFRNGFAHFVAYGLREGRSPHPDLDLGWYAGRDEVRADIASGLASDAFVHWITIGHAAGLAGRPPPVIHLTQAQAIALYERRANIIFPLYGRHRLDFTCRGTPTVSVIMAVRDRFAETMVSLASLRAQYRGEIELILIDSTSARLAMDIETHITGATILKFGSALDDAAARQAGLVCSTAAAILLLADGIDVAPGAIDNALARLSSDPTIGAVGGRLVQPNGSLLEAGGIIWRNGDLHAYARDASPSAAEANFVRDVDFCSTVFLLARRDVLTFLPEQAAGISGTTHDAADLCARIHQAGFRVVFEPDSIAFLTNEPPDRLPDGQPAFVAAYPEYLAGQAEFDPEAIIHARSPDNGRMRILFVEDTIPLRRIGSGFVRSNDVVRTMVALGASVTVFPLNENLFPLSVIRAELPDSVEVMHGLRLADFARFLAERRGCYDLIWIARTHNLELVHEALAGEVDDEFGATARSIDQPAQLNWTFDLEHALRQDFSQFDTAPTVTPGRRQSLTDALGQSLARHDAAPPRIVVDTEAISAVRQAGRAAMLNESFDLETALNQEFRHIDAAMDVVAVCEAEAQIIRAHHRGKVHVLGHTITASPTPRPFRERTGILFVGAIHDLDHPNHDGLTWFIEEVLPLIESMLRWETRLTIAGYIAPGITLDRFKGHSRVTLRGPVSELAPLYDANRVFIAPARFAAGIPYKVHEAAAFGLPVVTTALLARQLGWMDSDAVAACDGTDPSEFAARVVALHRDPGLWTRQRDSALARVRAELTPDLFDSGVERVLQAVSFKTRGKPHI
jgi:glycosyltransferase involved in cell wall biosynthesis